MKEQGAVCDLHPIYPMAPLASAPGQLRCTRFGCARRYSEGEGYFDADAHTSARRTPFCGSHTDRPAMIVAEVETATYSYVCPRAGCSAAADYSVPVEFRKPVQRAFVQRASDGTTGY
jgi:hypothetical protein